MDWIDDSRREASEARERVRRKNLASQSEGNTIARDLDRALPDGVKKRAISIGSELILPYEDALTAISLATERQIAVLGFDSGEVMEDGFQVLDYTGYDRDIPFTGDWKAYVAVMNDEAERWIKGHRLDKNCGYILTSTSETEFAKLG